ncbi:MAG: hypothetical protein IT269_09030 [Saprospiraceae bacterium]|nr:hypothetical protein [Saprospiraceae bacterium]
MTFFNRTFTFTILLTALLGISGGPRPSYEPERGNGGCNGPSQFYGYTFLLPEIINSNAAYAPYFLRWDDYYQRYYFNRDIQKEENIAEWKGRFCDIATEEDIEYLVYKSDLSELSRLYSAATDKTRKTTLPPRLAGNSFAEVLMENGCSEAISYLMFAKKCEPYVLAPGDGWRESDRDTASMYALVREGLGRFKNTESHFVRLRYAYQIVRMAHYLRDWQYTVDLYNYLMPKVERKRKSIIFYWTLGHLAGALLQLGHYPEAAHRYSVIFRNCASKRESAHRSWLIRNDDDWKKALKLCESDAEKSTLHLLRAGESHTYAVPDMETIYNLEPANPQLELLLVSDVQELEKIYLRTWVTDKKKGKADGSIKREAAAQHLLDLQKFVRRVMREKSASNPNLWRGMLGYLELLSGDRYAASKTWDRLLIDLKKNDGEALAANNVMRKQIETWRILADILNLDTDAEKADEMAFEIRRKNGFADNPNFEPFLQEWLSAAYATQNRPGRAIIAAYPPSALGLNPDMKALDDILALASQNDPVLLEYAMQMDTNPDRIKAYFLELKGMMMLANGEPEAAVAVMRTISPTEQARMPKFTPFREVFDDKVHRSGQDSLMLNRLEIARKIIDYELKAKGAAALNSPAAAWYNYLIGMAYFNMSYFGQEWRALDNFRSGYNQLRLASGPVFPLRNSPLGNRENTDVSRALEFFEKARKQAVNNELAARATYMAARCQQKMYYCSPDCRYRYGSELIPVIPADYSTNYERLIRLYSKTDFYAERIKSCKWLEAYAR